MLAVLGVTLLAEPTLAQHNLQRTLTVDPSGNVDVNMATITPPPVVITGQSYEFVVRSPR